MLGNNSQYIPDMKADCLLAMRLKLRRFHKFVILNISKHVHTTVQYECPLYYCNSLASEKKQHKMKPSIFMQKSFSLTNAGEVKDTWDTPFSLEHGASPL